MKHLYTFIACVALLLAANVTSAQAQSITKSWRLSFDESKAYMSKQQQDGFKYLDPNALKALREAFETTQYEFKANGSVEVAFYAGGTVTRQYAGTWKKSGDELSLQGIGGNQQNNEVFKIIKLTGRLLVLQKDGGSKLAFVAQ
jgi:hypothetical protein